MKRMSFVGVQRALETEGKATQSLPYLGIHPMNSHQTPTLLWMIKSALPKGTCYGCLQRGSARALQIQRQMLTAIGLSMGFPMDKLKGRLEELKVFAAQWEER